VIEIGRKGSAAASLILTNCCFDIPPLLLYNGKGLDDVVLANTGKRELRVPIDLYDLDLFEE